MQTRFLQEVRLSEVKQKQIVALGNLSEPAVCKLIEFIAGIDALPIMTPQKMQSLAERLNLSGKAAMDAYWAIMYLLSNMGKYSESADLITRDLIDSGAISEEAGSKIKSILDRLSTKAAAISFLSQQNDVAFSGASSLRAMTTSTALKPVFRERYAYDREPVTKYLPEVIGFVPVAQVEIGIDDITDTRKCINFCLTEEGLDRLISDLVALQTEMKSMKKSLPLKA